MNAGRYPHPPGAFAVKELVSTHEQWDISELVGGVDSEPQEAADLAKDLSRLTREGRSATNRRPSHRRRY